MKTIAITLLAAFALAGCAKEHSPAEIAQIKSDIDSTIVKIEVFHKYMGKHETYLSPSVSVSDTAGFAQRAEAYDKSLFKTLDSLRAQL